VGRSLKPEQELLFAITPVRRDNIETGRVLTFTLKMEGVETGDRRKEVAKGERVLRTRVKKIYTSILHQG
jgi:hypothetical protein